MQKLSAFGLSLTTVACLSGATLALPVVAQGATTEELQAQITALLAQIQALQAQLGTAQGSTSVPTITRDLTVGSTGNDVKSLQQFLNAQGYTVAASGIGSVGNETTYFGSLTQAALAKYQAAKGISPAAGYFGSITRAYLSSVAGTGTGTGTGTTGTGTTTTTGRSGNQGSMEAKLAASPASGEDLYENESGQAIYGIEINASDSEVYISRIKLQFNTAIYNIIDKIGIYRDGTLLAEKAVNSDNVTRITSTNYTVQVTGFESKVEKGATATFIVKVDALSSVDSGYSSFTVLAPIDAVTGVDGANIALYAPTSALTANTVNVKQGGASAALLTISKNASTPDEANVVADSTGKADKVTLLVMNVKAEEDSVKLTDLVTTISTTGVATTSVAYLYDGTTVIDSATVTAGTGVTTFADFSWTVPKNTTKQLTVKADFTAVANTESTASTTVSTTDADTVAEGSDGIALAAGNKSASATGNIVHMFKIAPIFTLTSAVVTRNAAVASVSSSTANVNIKFTVKAEGGDVTVTSTDAINLHAYVSDVATDTLTEAYNISGATLSGGVYTIAQDSTATFEVSGQLATTGWNTTRNYDFRIDGFLWHPGAGAAAITTSFLDDLSTTPFKTNIVTLP